LEERGVSYQTREMAEHPSLGLPIDEVQTGVVATSRATTFSANSPLQEYIDMACNTVWLLIPLEGETQDFLNGYC